MATEIKISQFDSIATEDILSNFYVLAVRRDALGDITGNNKITLQQIVDACQVNIDNLTVPVGTADGLVLTTSGGELILSTPTGGAGTPGGLPGQLQFYGISGNLEGVTDSSWDGTTLELPRFVNFGETSSLSGDLSFSITANGVTTEFAGLQIYNDAGRGLAEVSVGTDGLIVNRFVIDADELEPIFFRGLVESRVLHTGNVKTIGGSSIFGSGDIPLGAGGVITRTITVGFDAGKINGLDQPLVTGLRYELRAPYGLDPTEWTLLPKAGSSGDITIEVRKRPFSSGTFSSIVGGVPPSISGGARGTSSAAGWSNIDSGDLIEFEITSVTGNVFGITLIIEANEI